jgi:methylthioribose-1-phosphate isomerase
MKISVEGKPREMRALWYDAGKVVMIDQRLLPSEFRLVTFTKCSEVAASIKDMTVRGAPAIGVAAAYGMLLATRDGSELEAAGRLLKSTRPTAHDLFYAVDFMLDAARSGRDPEEAARSYADSIVDKCRKIGEYGEPLIKDGANIMTHCNAGALATVDYGTALAPMRAAWNKGRKMFVYVSETRPRLQGMKLTAYELLNEGIPHAIIPDGASGHFMRKGVDAVIVGADRIAANGDFANKIGTYEKAVLAKELGIPFYTAAPISTFDFSIEDGTQIPIEDRSEDEVTMIDGHRIAPQGCRALNPSFDMTPNRYVTGIITEIGIVKPNEVGKVRRMLQ